MEKIKTQNLNFNDNNTNILLTIRKVKMKQSSNRK